MILGALDSFRYWMAAAFRQLKLSNCLETSFLKVAGADLKLISWSLDLRK